LWTCVCCAYVRVIFDVQRRQFALRRWARRAHLSSGCVVIALLTLDGILFTYRIFWLMQSRRHGTWRERGTRILPARTLAVVCRLIVPVVLSRIEHHATAATSRQRRRRFWCAVSLAFVAGVWYTVRARWTSYEMTSLLFWSARSAPRYKSEPDAFRTESYAACMWRMVRGKHLAARRRHDHVNAAWFVAVVTQTNCLYLRHGSLLYG